VEAKPDKFEIEIDAVQMAMEDDVDEGWDTLFLEEDDDNLESDSDREL